MFFLIKVYTPIFSIFKTEFYPMLHIDHIQKKLNPITKKIEIPKSCEELKIQITFFCQSFKSK